MCSKTTIALSPTFNKDRFWLNKKEESMDNRRLQRCLQEIRRLVAEKDEVLSRRFVHIASENNFPTAAGLASSAAGYACLVFTLGQLYSLSETTDLSCIARQGSGSACRSIYGGLVQWFAGELSDGSDSVARPVAAPNHWPDLRAVICVVSDCRKKTGSTDGMSRSVATSQLLKHRIKTSVVQRMSSILEAVQNKNWGQFCDLTMADSNEFHAVCQDTFPPCIYMSDTSHAISQLVHDYNRLAENENRECDKICYTFDAGPNACLFVPGQVLNQVVELLIRCFPPPKGVEVGEYMRGLQVESVTLPQNVTTLVWDEPPAGLLQYIIHTSIGEGPRILPIGNDLLDAQTGLPKDV